MVVVAFMHLHPPSSPRPASQDPQPADHNVASEVYAEYGRISGLRSQDQTSIVIIQARHHE